MKKLLTLNIGEGVFRDKYMAACARNEISTEVMRSKYMFFVLEDGVVWLFHRDQEIKPNEYGYMFIRVAGRFTLMTSLVARYMKKNQVILSDDVYLDHTKNEEKITQMLIFTLTGIPIPKSTLFTIAGFAENKTHILKHVSFPCVLKTNGSQGRNVWKIENEKELEDYIAGLPLSFEVAMIQEFIPNSYDIRALYVHGDIIGAIRRSSVDGFRNNVSAGGTTEKIDLEEHEHNLTKQACEVLGRSFAGVDIVRTESGPKIFEVNLGPQVYGFESATGMNVPEELILRMKRTYLG